MNMKTKTQVLKNAQVTPKAMMEDLGVDFVSLVKQGANKQPFKMFKSAEGDGKEPVDKSGLAVIMQTDGLGSSFSGAMEAIDTAEKLEESRDTLEESFFVFKMVIKGVLEDNEITDKSKGLKKATNEFSDFVGKLFDGVSVQKASEMLNMEGDMKTNSNSDGSTSEVAKANDGGTSSNGQPDGKNRKAPATDVKGISKKKGMAKMLTSAIAKATAEVEGLMAEDFVGNQDKIAKANTNIDALEAQLVEVEKAVGDRTEDATATGEDTVAKNGDESQLGDTQPAGETGDTSGAVAKKKGEDDEGDGKGKPFGGKKAPPFVKKEGETEVEGEGDGNTEVVKDTVGTKTPDEASSQDMTGGVANVNEQSGALNMKSFEGFMKTFQVSLDGKISAMSDLIKDQGKEIETLKKGHKKVDSLTKMAGLSNAQDLDFTVNEEQATVQKSEDSEWSQVTSGNGSIKKEVSNNKRS